MVDRYRLPPQVDCYNNWQKTELAIETYEKLRGWFPAGSYGPDDLAEQKRRRDIWYAMWEASRDWPMFWRPRCRRLLLQDVRDLVGHNSYDHADWPNPLNW